MTDRGSVSWWIITGCDVAISTFRRALPRLFLGGRWRQGCCRRRNRRHFAKNVGVVDEDTAVRRVLVMQVPQVLVLIRWSKLLLQFCHHVIADIVIWPNDDGVDLALAQKEKRVGIFPAVKVVQGDFPLLA